MSLLDIQPSAWTSFLSHVRNNVTYLWWNADEMMWKPCCPDNIKLFAFPLNFSHLKYRQYQIILSLININTILKQMNLKCFVFLNQSKF